MKGAGFGLDAFRMHSPPVLHAVTDVVGSGLENSRENETTPETVDDSEGTGIRAEQRVAVGFVVLWASEEPEYLGAWLPVTTGDALGPRVLGRGPARADDEYPRLSALRQRPGSNEALPPFRSEALSRVQLLVRPSSPERLVLENLGRRRLFVNGAAADRHEAQVGDIVEIGGRLVLLCAQRPVRLTGSAASSEHAFGRADTHGIVGESPAAWQLRSDIAFAAPRPGHVLILGATGTGKEHVARAFHERSGRKGRLVARNAATLPESLVDAELFGNPKGYPNPGMPEREGLIGAAHEGTLFLDEFADLPAGSQTHVLRVLDSGEYQRLGESMVRRSDFRLIGATNRSEMSLRADLLARFDFRLRVPGLEARREDVPLLLRHLFDVVTEDDRELSERFCSANGLPRLGTGFMRSAVQHPFASNVRELRQLLWRSFAESSGDALEWPEQTRGGEPVDGSDGIERDKIQHALDANRGSIEKTWRALGLANRYVLRRLIAKYDLSVTRRGGGE
jgi:DNA-binding NtrC family response regulator